MGALLALAVLDAAVDRTELTPTAGSTAWVMAALALGLLSLTFTYAMFRRIHLLHVLAVSLALVAATIYAITHAPHAPPFFVSTFWVLSLLALNATALHMVTADIRPVNVPGVLAAVALACVLTVGLLLNPVPDGVTRTFEENQGKIDAAVSEYLASEGIELACPEDSDSLLCGGTSLDPVLDTDGSPVVPGYLVHDTAARVSVGIVLNE